MQKNNDQKALKRQAIGKGIAIGMVLFLPFGFILTILIGNPAFIGMGLPLAVAVGTGIGESLYQRRVREHDSESD